MPFPQAQSSSRGDFFNLFFYFRAEANNTKEIGENVCRIANLNMMDKEIPDSRTKVAKSSRLSRIGQIYRTKSKWLRNQ